MPVWEKNVHILRVCTYGVDIYILVYVMHSLVLRRCTTLFPGRYPPLPPFGVSVVVPGCTRVLHFFARESSYQQGFPSGRFCYTSETTGWIDCSDQLLLLR